MERPHRKLTAPWNDCPWEIATENTRHPHPHRRHHGHLI